MITHMHIENFKCFKDFDIDLGPFNVLIGPNDSGKTTLLKSVSMVCSLRPGSGGGRANYWGGAWEEMRWRGNQELKMVFDVTATSSTPELAPGHLVIENQVCDNFTSKLVVRQDAGTFRGNSPGSAAWNQDWFEAAIGESAYYRMDPKAIRTPSPFVHPMDETGFGLATFLDDMKRVHGKAFAVVENAFCERFRYYRELPIAKANDGKQPCFVMTFRPVHGIDLSVKSVSDGVLVSLAFLAIGNHPSPPRILLVEEPENHVHHASLKDIVATLRQLSSEKGVQVILTTHSPYLVQEVEPEDVRVFSKDEEGAVHAVRLSDYPEVKKMQKYFGTGEIWTDLEERDIVAKVGANK